MSDLSRHSVIAAEGEYLSATVENEEVILDPDSGTYYGVNPVGSHVLDVLKGGPASVDHVVDTIVETFDVDRERAEANLLEYLQTLLDENLVTVVDDG